jgi:hypothetical protein
MSNKLFEYLGTDIRESSIFNKIFGGKSSKLSGSPTRYLTNKKLGIQIATNTKFIVNAIFLFSNGKEEFSEYAGEIPFNLRFSMNREDVRKLMNRPPDFSIEAGGEGIMRITENTDKWFVNNSKHYVYVNYKEKDSTVSLITIGLNDE